MRFLSIFISMLFCFSIAEAAKTGEITAVDGDKIHFHIGDIPVEPGENLRVWDSRGEANITITVLSVDGQEAVGEITHLLIRPFGTLERIRPGHIVRLEANRSGAKGFGFQLGANTSQEVAGYRGQYSLGLWAGGAFHDRWWWLLRWHADDMGEVAAIKHRRSSYMAGLGYELNSWRFEGHLGLIDSMTMVDDGAAIGRADPVTGKTVMDVGVQNDNEFAGMLVVSYRFDLRRIDRNRFVGWSLSPTFSYGNTFASTPYGAVTSAAVSLEFWTE